MLVKFSNTSGHSLSMFENQAKKMLRAMDMTGNIPGAINPEDLQAALDHLEQSIQKEAATEKPVEFGDEVFDDERKAIERQIVSATARAFPLIELLKISIKKQKSVMWEYE
jgi:hypothetical protein